MRHRITIQQKTTTPDGAGGYTSSWSTFKTIWAQVSPATGRERFFGGKVEAVITHRISTRFIPGVTTFMRIAYGTRIFQIHAALNVDEYGQWLNILCEEGVGS